MLSELAKNVWSVDPRKIDVASSLGGVKRLGSLLLNLLTEALQFLVYTRTSVAINTSLLKELRTQANDALVRFDLNAVVLPVLGLVPEKIIEVG